MATAGTRKSANDSDRAPLSRQRIVGAAVDIATTDGLKHLSMRRLAQQLGYEPMSLYNHVANKDDLVEAMVESVAAEIELPPTEVEWKDGIRSLAESTRQAMLRHPWVVDIWTSTFPGPERFGRMERLLELLSDGNLSDHVADLGFHSINTHVNGYTRQAVGYRSIYPDDTIRDRFAREVSADRFPRMVEHVDYHDAVDAGAHDHPDEFRYVLDLILDGLERARDMPRTDPT